MELYKPQSLTRRLLFVAMLLLSSALMTCGLFQIAPPRRASVLGRWLQGTVLAAVLLTTALTLFYARANRRGERAWQESTNSLLAGGWRLDPAAFAQPPVPDEENFLKAPRVVEWLDPYRGSPGQAPVGVLTLPRTGDEELLGEWSHGRPAGLEEWRTLFQPARESRRRTDSGEQVPLIVIDAVPLGSAIRNLARQAGVNFQFDGSTADVAEGRPPRGHVPISIRFENVTAHETLEAVLNNYGLALERTKGSPIYRIITARQPPRLWPEEPLDLATASLGGNEDERIQSVVIDHVPPLDALRNVFRQTRLNCQFAPDVITQTAPTHYTLSVSNITYRQLLSRVLNDHRLALQRGAGNIFHVVQAPLVRRPPGYNAAATVLAAFDQFDEEFRALAVACQRPYSRMEDFDGLREPTRGFNFSGYWQVSHALVLHASAQLALSNSTAALGDATALARLCQSFRRHPRALPPLAQMRLTWLYLQVVWEGLAARRWHDTQLRLLDQQLRSFDLLSDLRADLEREQAALVYAVEHPSTKRSEGVGAPSYSPSDFANWSAGWWPRGWALERHVAQIRELQQEFRLMDRTGPQVYPEREPPAPPPPPSLLRAMDRVLPVLLVQARYFSLHAGLVSTATRGQTAINLARVACALERYRQTHGEYPQRLDALWPQWIDRLPLDLVCGKPLQYRCTDDDQFVLYSVGWDRQDQGGQGDDVVWRYPMMPVE